MEQRDYIYEIILEILKGENHARNIAKKLETNHMNIVRALKKLLEFNVLDFKTNGKNKTFFLKNTIEARNYVLMSEHYKLLRILNKYPELRRIIEKIQIANNINIAVLFGSYAKSIAKKESDIDIYIDTKDNILKKEIQSISNKLSIKIGKFDKDSLLAKEILKNHCIIKGVEEFYEKNNFLNKTKE